ncbi:MAG: cytochrome c biosis protein CcmE [Chromatiaceae bacterium]|nr:cytochrome c biosis protein CcmE [Chromatiaceae bacterium]
MKARQKRLVLVGLAIVGVGAAAALALSALQSNISYFFSPSQVLAKEAPADHVFRLGGLVSKGTVKRAEDGLTVTFDVTDMAQTVKVRLGPDGIFYAEEVLAKHDEEYMPPEVADTLKTAHAQGMTGAAGAQPDQVARQVQTSGAVAQ